MSDPYLIRTVEELRGVIPDPPAMMHETIYPELNPYARAFVERSPFLLLSTSDAAGNADTSPKGDAPGFARIVDEHTLLIPDRPGNKLAKGHLNLLENPQVATLFLIPGTPETLRVNGRAEITRDPQLLEQLSARSRPAVLAIRLHVEECFFHCAKAFLRAQLWKPETWPERHRVSFGKMFAERLKAPDVPAAAASIDAAIEDDYRENL